MPIRYRPIAAWLARATAHQLLHGRYPPSDTDAWMFADVRPIIDGGLTHDRIKRYSDFDYFETNMGRKGTSRPVALDYVVGLDSHRGTRASEAYYLEGIGLTEAAISWLIEQRYVPVIYAPLLRRDDHDGDLLTDPNFLFWRDNIYLAPPETCPVQTPATVANTRHDKTKTYTQDERAEAHRIIDARLDLTTREKAVHKAHVSRRTVTA